MNPTTVCATMKNRGTRIVLTGPLACTQFERVDMRVTITQRTTGAVGEGRVRFTGAPKVQFWEAEVTARGQERFEEGPATAVAVAVTSINGRANDAHQWLMEIVLEWG